MAPFLYYVRRMKEAGSVDKQDLLSVLQAAGLTAMEGNIGRVMKRDVYSGPDGGAGTVLALPPVGLDAKDFPLIGYDKACQQWQEVGDGVWIGFDKVDVPSPSDMERASMTPGHFVELADGHEWLVPTVRRFPSGTTLPSTMSLNEDGQIEYHVKAEYQDLYSEAEKVYESFVEKLMELPTEPVSEAKVLVSIDDATLYRIGVAALAVNYHLGRHEVNLLALFDTSQSLVQLCLALIDWPTVEATLLAIKKKQDEAQGGHRNSG